MMNHDYKFQERWEFRRQDFDKDSSSDDDSRPDSMGDPLDRNHKLFANHMVSTENDETIDAPECQQADKSVEVVEKEMKPSTKKKKKVEQKEKFKKCSSKEKNEDRKRKANLSSEEVVMFKDLKMFGDSLIHDLKVARENMFGRMKEEMSKLVDSRPKLELKKKNVRRSPKKNTKPLHRKGTEAGMKSQKPPIGDSKAVEAAAKTNELNKGDGSRISTDMISAGHSDQVFSSCLTLPSVLLKPNHNGYSIPSSDHIPAGEAVNNSSSGLETGKSMDAKNIYQQFQEFQQISCKSVGQKSGVGLPSPLHQVLDNGSNISSLTRSGNSFSSNVDPRMNGPTALARFPNSISGSSVPPKSDAEFLSQLAGTRMTSFTGRRI